MVDKDNPVWMTKAEWQAVRGNSLVASVQVGRWDFNGDIAVSRRGSSATTDIATLYRDRQLFHLDYLPQ